MSEYIDIRVRRKHPFEGWESLLMRTLSRGHEVTELPAAQPVAAQDDDDTVLENSPPPAAEGDPLP
jgi:hypothetical protein